MRTPWPAVLALARLELRHRWRAILALGLAGAALAGGVLAVATVQWRTDSAYPRLVARSGLEDVRVMLIPQFTDPAREAAAERATAANADRIAARPEVDEAIRIGNYLGRLSGPGVQYVGVAAPDRPYARLGRPVVVRGRAPAATRPDEVIVEEGRARLAGLGVGDRVPLDLLTTRQFLQFSTGIGRPAGGHVELRIVGVFRYPAPARIYNSLIGSPAFARAHGGVAVGQTLLLRTRQHVDATAFAAQAATLNRTMTAAFGTAQMPYVALESPRADPDPGLGPTRTVLRSGLIALAAVVLGAGLILAFQLAGRWGERGRESQQVEAVLGLRTRERVTARVLAALPAVALAAAGGVAGALLGGLAEPLGALRRYEPDPGWRPNAAIAAAGGVAAAVVVAGATALAVAAATRGGRFAGRPRRRRPARPRPALPTLAGALAAPRGDARTAMPARSVIAALAAVLAMTVVVADLHRQLAGIAGAPARWGWTADLQVVDDDAAVDARLRHDPRVRDAEQLTSTDVELRHGGTTAVLSGYGRATLRGSLPWTLAAGRIPLRAGEVALGPRAAHDLAVGVGDRVFAAGPHGWVRLAVVGLVVLPTGNREPLGSNVLVTRAQLARLSAGAPYSGLAVRATDAAAARALVAELGRDYELETPVAPDTVAALDELGGPTRILLAVLLLGVLLLVVQTVRLLLRRRRGQLAIAHVLGMPARTLVAATVAAVLAGPAVAAVVGAPLGWAASRLVLDETGPRLGLALHRPDVGPALLVVAAAAVAALLVGLAGALGTVVRLRVTPERE